MNSNDVVEPELSKPPRRERRYKIICFEEGFLTEVLNWSRNPPGWLSLPEMDALPDDSVVIAVHWSHVMGLFEAIVESATFPAVPAGQMFERIDTGTFSFSDLRVIPFDDAANVQTIAELRAEIERLKRGDFTEAEFQNLCHNLNEDDACRFRAGCEEYQRKLFGTKTGDAATILSGSYVDDVGVIRRWFANDAPSSETEPCQ